MPSPIDAATVEVGESVDTTVSRKLSAEECRHIEELLALLAELSEAPTSRFSTAIRAMKDLDLPLSETELLVESGTTYGRGYDVDVIYEKPKPQTRVQAVRSSPTIPRQKPPPGGSSR